MDLDILIRRYCNLEYSGRGKANHKELRKMHKKDRNKLKSSDGGVSSLYALLGTKRKSKMECVGSFIELVSESHPKSTPDSSVVNGISLL